MKATAQTQRALTGEFFYPKPASFCRCQFLRAEFKLRIFPPDHHVPPAPPTPPAPQTPAK